MTGPVRDEQGRIVGERLSSFEELEDKRGALSERGVITRVVVVEATDTERTILRLLAHTFQFPAWFGMNWNAVDDSLIEVDWLGGATSGAVLVALPELPTVSIMAEHLRDAFEYALP